jgi:nitric oxide synthase-interacting protein
MKVRLASGLPSIHGLRLLLGRGTKRKFEFDATNVESIAAEAEGAAVRQMEKEQALALKHKLPDFWLPSLTPTYTSSGPPQGLDDIQVQTTCRGGNPAHELTLKGLTQVVFSKLTSGPSKSAEPASTEGKTREVEADTICPSCKKKLSNNTLIFCECRLHAS